MQGLKHEFVYTLSHWSLRYNGAWGCARRAACFRPIASNNQWSQLPESLPESQWSLGRDACLALLALKAAHVTDIPIMTRALTSLVGPPRPHRSRFRAMVGSIG